MHARGTCTARSDLKHDHGNFITRVPHLVVLLTLDYPTTTRWAHQHPGKAAFRRRLPLLQRPPSRIPLKSLLTHSHCRQVSTLEITESAAPLFPIFAMINNANHDRPKALLAKKGRYRKIAASGAL